VRAVRVTAPVAAAFVCAVVIAATTRSVQGVPPPQDDDRLVVHVLNRVAFGPRAGDVARVRALGVQKYIAEQLRPEKLHDANAEARLAGLSTVTLSSRDIAEKYEIPQIEARKERKANAAAKDRQDGERRMPDGDRSLEPSRQRPVPDQRANLVVMELGEQKVLRAVYSERQLQEVLTDFWFNHFNVDARKGPSRFMLTEYERDVIRPHVFGKFRDLLEAVAKSPAMLFYLDNWMSADPNGRLGTGLRPTGTGDLSPGSRPRIVRGPFGGRSGTGLRPRTPGDLSPAPHPRPQPQGKNAPKGLNENYGRELMELHTLGVDGGYTQKDVTEVARAFTGWTIDKPRQGGGFRFEPRIHDQGQKVVLGHVIKAGGGQGDGEQVLDLLARHPSTARFLATKLVRRFVSDTPPATLVDRAAARFRETDGDLREVMRTILTSQEFWSPDAYRAKVKTPVEFVASALRATAADVQDATPLVRTLQQFGMPLYMCQPPTGYKDTADAWVNTGALVARMNFALQLASNKLNGVVVQMPAAMEAPTLLDSMLGGDASDATRATIAKAKTPEQMVALTLGSPEFQRK
jgi:uncharacterized protein (DUF1800 family)